MKKRNGRKKQSSFGFIHIFLILIFVAGVTFVCMSILMPAKEKNDDNGPIDTETPITSYGGSDIGKGGDDTENPDKTPKQNEDDQNTDSDTIDFSITKNEVVGDKYMLRVNIYEDVKTSGTCILEMKSSKGDYLKRTATVIEAGAEYSTCEGFDIQKSGIASGDYTFTIKVEIGDRSRTISSSIKI